jgi:HD-GYP domain-containing protein (c-di-GMP phosphodiesterase class II)
MICAPATPQSLLPIAVETLRCGESFDFDLYMRAVDGEPVLYRGRRFPIQRRDLNSLDQRGIRTLYITADAQQNYSHYLREQVMGDKSAPASVRYCALREANRTLFDSLLGDSNVNQVVELVEQLATDLTQIIHDQQHAIDDLDMLLCHDYRTYAHATNVGAYTALLARRMGVSDKQELEKIIVGAMLHDFGKRNVPSSILNKKGRLTDGEFRIVKRHPADGFRDLCQRDDLTWSQLMIAYQHHERLDGKGYPTGIQGEDILPWSRMCAITNVYDGMTCIRPYREPLQLSEVQDYFSSSAAAAYDPEMVRCWLAVITEKG